MQEPGLQYPAVHTGGSSERLLLPGLCKAEALGGKVSHFRANQEVSTRKKSLTQELRLRLFPVLRHLGKFHTKVHEKVDLFLHPPHLPRGLLKMTALAAGWAGPKLQHTNPPTCPVTMLQGTSCRWHREESTAWAQERKAPEGSK